MNVLGRDTVTAMVVPYGIHTAKDGRIFLFEHFLAYMSRCPIIIKMFTIQIIIIVTCLRHDVSQSVRNGNQFIALLYHVARFCIAVVPSTHDDVFALHRSFALGMGQSTPYTGLFAEAFHIADIAVGKFAELFHYLRVLVGVFVGTDVYTLATEHRFFTFQIFLEEAIHKFVSLRVEEVKVVHAVFLRTDFR